MIYRLIRDEGSLSVRQRCRIARVSPSAYYAWGKSSGHEGTDEQELALVKQMQAILLELPGYGYRRVTEELHRRGVVVNRKRVQQLMPKHHLQRRKKQRFVRTTNSNHSLPVYPNLIKEMVIQRPNQLWAADITYVRLLRGFVYLAVILDLFSRKVIGWALSASLNAELVVEALQVALQSRSVEPGLIHHSDQGGFSMPRTNMLRYCSSTALRSA